MDPPEVSGMGGDRGVGEPSTSAVPEAEPVAEVEAEAAAQVHAKEEEEEEGGDGGTDNRHAKRARTLDAEVTHLRSTNKEWRKNIRRKVCDANVVADQIAERAIRLLKEHSAKSASTKNAAPVLTLVSKSELERMAKDKAVREVAEKRLASLANKAALLILERLMSHKWAWLFNEPVNAEELNLKDYHTIVKKPMALSTVKNRAQAGYYKTASEAAGDIRLVFENALLYNKPGSDVNIMASAMLEKFEDLWQSKVAQKFNEEEAVAKSEESMARKKRVDALRAQQNGVFRQKCQSYERLLCDVESFLIEVQQQIIVSCKPVAGEKRQRAQKMLEKTPFEQVKPALGVILQRYPEMLNTATQEVEVDLSKVDPLTLRQVLALLEGDASRESSEVKEVLDAWANVMLTVLKLHNT